jgi:hypothetical protein
LQVLCACNLRCLRTKQPADFYGSVRTVGIDDDDFIKDPRTHTTPLEVPPPRSIFEKRLFPGLNST